MKNIAIATINHFKDNKILIELLDELVHDHVNVRFLISSLDSAFDFINQYCEEKYHSKHIYIADWQQHINADIVRDKRMIEDADILVVIDDKESNRIKLLTNWADEKNIFVKRVEVEPHQPCNYFEVLNLKIMDPLDKEEIQQKINQLELAKEHAMNNGDFEIAAIIRDKIRMIVNRI